MDSEYLVVMHEYSHEGGHLIGRLIEWFVGWVIGWSIDGLAEEHVLIVRTYYVRRLPGGTDKSAMSKHRQGCGCIALGKTTTRRKKTRDHHPPHRFFFFMFSVW